jgi:hypothetical protein
VECGYAEIPKTGLPTPLLPNSSPDLRVLGPLILSS